MKLPAIILTDQKLDKNKIIVLAGSFLLFTLLLLSANKKPTGLLANGNVITVISGAVITSLGVLSYKKFN